MSWEFAPTFDAAHRAALESGKPLVYVTPPAGWALAPLLDRLPAGEPAAGPEILILAPDPTDAADLSGTLGWIAPLRPLVSSQGAARTERLLRKGVVRTLVTTPAEALSLARRAALKLESVKSLVVGWPESMLAMNDGPTLDAVLSEAGEAQRLILTTDERDPALSDFLTRYAHRAPAAVASRVPEMDDRVPAVRYVMVADQWRYAAVREVLDQKNPERALIWEPLPSRFGRWIELSRDPAVQVRTDPGDDPMDLAIAADLVSREVLEALLKISADVVVMVRPGQLAYLQRLTRTLKPVPLAGESDRVRDRAARARRRVRDRLAQGGLDAELMTLAPLFDEHDPALVAAAALALNGGDDAPGEPAPESAGSAAWVRLFVTAGRKDQLRPADIVGVLVNGVGLPKDHVGRVEIRDAFSLVEVRADDADRALRGLTGATIRGRRIAARPDRK